MFPSSCRVCWEMPSVGSRLGMFIAEKVSPPAPITPCSRGSVNPVARHGFGRHLHPDSRRRP